MSDLSLAASRSLPPKVADGQSALIEKRDRASSPSAGSEALPSDKTKIIPDYSPEILKAFLHARAVFNAASNGLSQAQAWRAVRSDLRKATKLKVADLDAAYAGRLNLEITRTRIWAALNVFPADFAVMLDDRGGQSLVSSFAESELPRKGADARSRLGSLDQSASRRASI